jgi:CxxC-x17-CxxC domain-containing protein
MNIKKLPQSKLNVMEFMKPCNKIFLETAKQFGIDTTEEDLNRLLRSDATTNNEYRIFQLEFYNQYFKTEAFTVTHDTTENIQKFKTVFEKLIRTSDDGKIRIIDRYVDGSLIENFIQHLPLEGLNHIEILASIKGMEKLDDYERLIQKANEFKEKLLSNINIKLEIKMYLSDFGSETLHHRTIQNNSMSYSIADGINNIFLGQPLGYVQQLDEKLVEASKPVWDEKWKIAVDVYEYPEIIKEKIKEKIEKDQRPREMHDAKCGDCGNDCQVPFQPKEDRPVYCRDCFQNHR